MERKGPYVKGKAGHPINRNPYLIRKNKHQDHIDFGATPCPKCRAIHDTANVSHT